MIPDESYDPLNGFIEADQFAWAFSEEIETGEIVDITGEFTNSDTDFMIWWTATDNSTWTFSNNLIEDDMISGDSPEVARFIAE